MRINPIKLIGNWDSGWALDKHTISSEYIGNSPFGHPLFRTIRSEIGELMYQLKYPQKYSVLSEIVDAVVDFLISHPEIKFDTILPVPPSKPRDIQPVLSIAEEVAKRCQAFYVEDVLLKETSTQAKNMTLSEKEALGNSIFQTKKSHQTLQHSFNR